MIQVGDKVTIKGLAEFTGTGRLARGKEGSHMRRQLSGVVVSVTPRHFTLHNGLYRESFLFVDYPKFRR